MTAEEVRALVDDEIRAATRVAVEPAIWDPACEPCLLAEPERQPSGLWLVFGPAYHADFVFYQVVFDEERRAFGLVFRGVFIGYRRGFIHALEGMPRIRERIGATITCPVCWEERPSEGAIGPLKWEPLFATLLNRANQPYDARFLYVCAVCLADGRAIRADAWAQNAGDGGPRQAYFDVTLTCEDCQSDFTFTASEQQFWYEELKFFEESRPKQCRRCRRIRRRRGALTAELGQALKALASKDPALLTRIADIYIELGDIEKASLYLRRAKNRTADPTDKAALIERLAELSREPDA